MPTTVCLTFDFDAISVWINDFKTVAPGPISRGEFGARAGVHRILDMLERQGVPATFFVPGHTVDHFTADVLKIKQAGHEIAGHGYLHEGPEALTRDEEVAVLEKSERCFERMLGLRPRGYRAPSWEPGPHTIALLAERGYVYDSSLMAEDYRPYRPRLGDVVELDGTYSQGKPGPIVELPVAYELDDFPYFNLVSNTPLRGLRNPDDVFAIWLGEFEYCHASVEDGIYVLTMHPQVIGRGPRIAMLERLVAKLKGRSGVTFSTMIDAARAAKV